MPWEAPPANLTAACPDMRDVPATMTMGELLAYTVDLTGDYKDCAARQKALTQWADRS